MRNDLNIFVEGIADARFLKQYIKHVFGEDIADNRIVVLNGWDNLKTEASASRMRSMSDNGGVNLVIVDADKDFQMRKNEIAVWKLENNVEFELFLLPNNKDTAHWKTCWRTSSTQITSRYLNVGKNTKRNS